MGRNNHQGASGRPLLGDVRRQEIASRLRAAGSVTVAAIEADFGVSPMTARRDLAALESAGLARRTHGGAVLPSISAHEDSFANRLERESEAKLAIGQAVAGEVVEDECLFVDSSSTAYHVVQALLDRRVRATVITNSLPVMELVAADPAGQVQLLALGGALRRLTRSFVGPTAVAAIAAHFADRVIFSVKGVTADGALTDADSLEAEVKREMIGHSAESVLLLDRSKVEARGFSVVARVGEVSRIVAHGLTPADAPQLSVPGVRITHLQDAA